eukprot:m.191805 g.191805  ORF g.191805 m.191805 type:complete len:73 (+) comp16960_c0_seq5:3082-3300(+)
MRIEPAAFPLLKWMISSILRLQTVNRVSSTAKPTRADRHAKKAIEMECILGELVDELLVLLLFSWADATLYT